MPKMQVIKNPINKYGNILVIGPDGTEMFRTGLKKANWYLNNNLAQITQIDNPLTIQLNFTPKGPGHSGDPYYLGEKISRCVICASEKSLTKHHVVPWLFRKNFPDHIKNHSCHDIVMICREHHDEYGILSDQYIKEIEKEIGVYINTQNIDLISLIKNRAIRSAITLKDFESSIPEDKKEHLKENIKKYLNKDSISHSDILAVASEDVRKTKSQRRKNSASFEFSQKAVEIIGYKNLSIRWRQHFMHTMKPKYMPLDWDIYKGFRDE